MTAEPRQLTEPQRAMVEANERLVYHIAALPQYAGHGVPFEDLVQAGFEGLMAAAQKFDVSVGAKFGTYAGQGIKMAIRREIQNRARVIRLPVWLQERRRRILASEARLAQELGRMPTRAEIATDTGIPLSTIIAALQNDAFSLDAPPVVETYPLHETIPGDPGDHSHIHDLIDYEPLRAAFATLPQRSQRILYMRFLASPQLTMRQAGAQLGISYERIRQIQIEAIEQLKQTIPANWTWEEGAEDADY